MNTKPDLSRLDALLRQAEGNPADFLDRLATEWPVSDALLRHLVAFAAQADPDAQVAATGLLRRYLAAGAAFPPVAVSPLLALIPALVRWEARLHGLQILPGLPIPKKHAAGLHEFLRGCLDEQNRFVRAWAYTGLHRLALLHAGYRAEVSALLETAARDEAPSVRARLRQLHALDG